MKTLYCAFCEKSQHQVAKLLSGPTVCICDECVRVCVEIIESNDAGAIEYDSWFPIEPRRAA